MPTRRIIKYDANRLYAEGIISEGSWYRRLLEQIKKNIAGIAVIKDNRAMEDKEKETLRQVGLSIIQDNLEQILTETNQLIRLMDELQ